MYIVFFTLAVILLVVTAYLYHKRMQNIHFYYINLDHSVERNEQYKKQFLSYPDYPIVRVNAVKPNDFKNLTIIKAPDCERLLETELACTISHLKAIHTAYHDNQEYAVICEDDMKILHMPDWNELIKKLPHDWEIIQLFSLGNEALELYKKYQNSDVEVVPRPPNVWSCVIYLINRKGMKKIINTVLPVDKSKWENIEIVDFSKTPIWCVADDIYYRMCNTYTFVRPFFNTFVNGKSTIHDNHLEYHAETTTVVDGLYESYIQNKTKHVSK